MYMFKGQKLTLFFFVVVVVFLFETEPHSSLALPGLDSFCRPSWP